MSEVKKEKKNLFTSFLTMPKTSDPFVHGAIMLLALCGTIMIASASMGIDVGNNKFLLITVIKQIIFIAAGYVMMTFLANHFRIDFLRSRWFFITIVGGTIILLLSCLLFEEQFGSQAWLRFSFFGTQVTIQPSEFAKISAFLVVAAYCGDFKNQFKSSWAMVSRPILFCFSFILIVLALQKDMGSAMVIFLITCISMLIPNHPQMKGTRIFLKVTFWLVLALAIYILTPAGESLIYSLPIKGYQKERFITSINPFADKYGNGYQLINGLISFATGGLFGTGFGSSIRKYTNFPAANNDYILAILVEEMGFVGFVVLMLMYGVILYRLLYYAMRMQNERGRIILVGTAMYLLIHMIFNIGGVTGLIPLTGVPLLMISAGGSATMSFMMAIGLSQAIISAYKRKEFK